MINPMLIYFIKFLVPAGKASGAPPVGPILGQYRLNMLEFCKTFNADTAEIVDGIVLPVFSLISSDFSCARKRCFYTWWHF